MMKFLIGIYVILYLNLNTFAQNTDNVRSDIGFLNQVWSASVHNQKLVFVPYLDAAQSISALSTSGKNPYSKNSQFQTLAEAEKEYAKGTYGVGFNAAIFQYLINGPLDHENPFAFRNRADVGMEWNLMKDGFFAINNKVKQIGNSYSVLGLMWMADSVNWITKQEREATNRAAYAYNVHKQNLMSNRLKIVEQYADVLQKLYERGLVKFTDYNMFNLTRSQISTQYNSLISVNKVGSYLFSGPGSEPPMLPVVFDIVAEKIINLKPYSQMRDEVADSLLNLQLLNKELANNLVNKVGFKVYGRYNMYNIPGITPKLQEPIRAIDFYQVGASLILPLDKGRSRFVKTVSNVAATQIDLTKYADNKAQAMEFIFAYKKLLEDFFNLNAALTISSLALDKENEKLNADTLSFNPVQALTKLDDYFLTRLKLLDEEETLYLALVHMKHTFDIKNISDVLTPLTVTFKTPSFKSSPYKEPVAKAPVVKEQPAVKELPATNQPAKEPPVKEQQPVATTEKVPSTVKKSIYIWSSSLADIPTDDLVKLLRKDQVENAIISVGLNGKTDYSTLVRVLGNNKISVEYLISNNNLIWSADRVKGYLDSVFTTVSLNGINTIHVDIEPQAMKASGVPMPRLMDMYVAMLREFKTYCVQHNKKLAVAIPLNGNKDNQSLIYLMADYVYIMAYETKNLNSIVGKVQNEFSFGKNKIRVAIRTEEFQSKSEMTDFMEKLNAQLKIDQFVIHDLKRWVKLP